MDYGMRLALALNRLVVIFADISLSHNLSWLLFHFGTLCCKQLRFQGSDGLVGWNCLQLRNLNLTFGLQSLFILFLVFLWTVKSFSKFAYIAYYTSVFCVFWTAKSWCSYFHYVDGRLLYLFVGNDVSNICDVINYVDVDLFWFCLKEWKFAWPCVDGHETTSPTCLIPSLGSF